MNNVLREYRIGNWCKRGAWVVAAIGLIDIVLEVYSVLQQTASSGPLPFSFILVDIVRAVLSIGSTTLFYFLILYCAGVVANHLARTSETPVAAPMPVVERKEKEVIAEEPENTVSVDTIEEDEGENAEEKEEETVTG